MNEKGFNENDIKKTKYGIRDIWAIYFKYVMMNGKLHKKDMLYAWIIMLFKILELMIFIWKIKI